MLFAIILTSILTACTLCTSTFAADLDADGVADAAQELEVGAVQLPRALAAPQEVPAAVVPAPSRSHVESTRVEPRC